jgi:hypothetical protein
MAADYSTTDTTDEPAMKAFTRAGLRAEVTYWWNGLDGLRELGA